VIIELSWNELKRAHPEIFDRIIRGIAHVRHFTRGEAIDVLDEEYSIDVTSDGCIRIVHDATGQYRMIST